MSGLDVACDEASEMELHMIAKHDSVDDVEVVFKRGVSSTTRGDDDLHDDHGQKLWK